MEAVRKISMAKNYHLARTFGLPMAPGKGPRNSYAGVLICVGGRGNRGDPYKSVEYLEAGEGKGLRDHNIFKNLPTIRMEITS